jgi:2,3-bisphosphoglycerate-dependent phosphoglycerate mutase
LEAGKRCARCLERVLQRLAQRAAHDTLKIVVGHGGAIRHAALELGTLELGDVTRLSMYHCRTVYLERLDEGRWVQVGGEWKQRRPA